MAQHASSTLTLASERAKALATLAASLVTLANAALALAGHNPLPFTDTQAGAAVSTLLGLAATLYAWWRNNSLTQAGVEGTQLTRGIKQEAASDSDEAGNQDQETTIDEYGDPDDVGDGHIEATGE